AAVLGEQHVGQAVVVDVADRDPHAVASHVEARPGTHVLERAVLILMKELVLRSLRPAVMNEIDVESAVVIEVKERRAGAHELRRKISCPWQFARVVRKAESKLLGHVLEPDGTGFFIRVDRLRRTAAKQEEAEEKDSQEWSHARSPTEPGIPVRLQF